MAKVIIFPTFRRAGLVRVVTTQLEARKTKKARIRVWEATKVQLAAELARLRLPAADIDREIWQFRSAVQREHNRRREARWQAGGDAA